MGKYSNVNVDSLTSGITNAINELSSYDIGKIKNELHNGTVLSSSANNKVYSALNSIQTNKSVGSVAKLKDYLNKIKSATSYITKYQKIEKEISNLETELLSAEENRVNRIKNSIQSKKNTLASYEIKIDEYLK